MKHISSIFDGFSNTLLSLVLIGIVSISTITVSSLSVRKVDGGVLGVSTDGVNSDRPEYDSVYLEKENISIRSFKSEEGYILKYKSTISAGENRSEPLVNIWNTTKSQKQYNVDVNTDPSNLEDVKIEMMFNNSLIPLNFDEFGKSQTQFLAVDPSQRLEIALLINGIKSTDNFGFELEISRY